MKPFCIRTLVLCSLAALMTVGSLFAAPKLRLSTTTFGPVDIAPGSNGPSLLVEASNTGDGSLALTASTTDTWLTPAVGAPAPCSVGGGSCLPVQIALSTVALALGVHTGVVTVSDPNALDAPQTVTITVQIGGGIPDEIALFVPPGGQDNVRFRTNSQISGSVSTQTGGNWLSLGVDGSGSFQFVVPYRVAGRDAASLSEGIYNGTIEVTASAFEPDVKTVPVTMQVTSQPIVQLTVERVGFELATDAAAADSYVAVLNRGAGTLSIDSVTATATDGGAWLKAELASGFVKVTADPAALTAGGYEGTITVETNAANSPHTIPVEFQVVAQAPPAARAGGVVNNATFAASDPIPLGGIAAVFGDQFSHQPPTTGTELPLVRELGGTKVLVNGVEAPLFYSSEEQINFQMPYETQPGEAIVQIIRDGRPGNQVTVQVAAKNPRILTFLGNYAIAVNTDGSFPVPPTPGLDSRPAHAGDTLVMYSIGFGPTAPTVPTGDPAPSDPLAHVVPTPIIQLGGGLLPVNVTPSFLGLTPTFVGLFQMNFTIPVNAPKGDAVPLIVLGPDYTTNQVDIAIQ
jgi:uncharacterized protein (TIGR03437 family)